MLANVFIEVMSRMHLVALVVVVALCEMQRVLAKPLKESVTSHDDKIVGEKHMPVDTVISFMNESAPAEEDAEVDEAYIDGAPLFADQEAVADSCVAVIVPITFVCLLRLPIQQQI